MESDKPDCHHVNPRHPKPRADRDSPDPDPDGPDADDHIDPDDLPNIPTFIFSPQCKSHSSMLVTLLSVSHNPQC